MQARKSIESVEQVSAIHQAISDQIVDHPQEPAPTSQNDKLDATLAVAKQLGFALSARALLFVALIGAFILGLSAMIKGGWMSLAVLIAYSLFTVIPIAYLEVRRRA